MKKLVVSLVAFWVSGLFLFGFSQDFGNSSAAFDVEKDSIYIPFEFRGAWLSTVESIDWPKVKIHLTRQTKEDGSVESSSEMKARISKEREQQKKDLVGLINAIKRTGCNAVMFQVVSNTDALYPSKILQWAPSLTDIPGEGPGYDPLALAVKTRWIFQEGKTTSAM